MTAREWNTAVGTGLLRIGAGVALLRWRRVLIRLAGADDDDRTVRMLFTYFGVRDITLGVATLAATHPNGDVAQAVTWQGVADTTDAALIAGVAARGHFPQARAIGLTALAAVTAVGEYVTALSLRRKG